MVPPPNPPHGDFGARMNKALLKFILDNDVKGDAHHPPEPIYRRAEGSNSIEPDMMYVSHELRARIGN